MNIVEILKSDRIEIENPGILLPGITFEDMKCGVSKIRNPVIARIFRELNLIEQWGSGVPRIMRETAEGNFPAPYIIELGHRTRFIFPLIAPIIISSGVQSGNQSRHQLDSVLLALSDCPLSSSEIAVILGLDSKTGVLKRTIEELLEEKMIEYTIPEKPTSRLQKYRLTVQGRQAVDSACSEKGCD